MKNKNKSTYVKIDWKARVLEETLQLYNEGDYRGLIALNEKYGGRVMKNMISHEENLLAKKKHYADQLDAYGDKLESRMKSAEEVGRLAMALVSVGFCISVITLFLPSPLLSFFSWCSAAFAICHILWVHGIGLKEPKKPAAYEEANIVLEELVDLNQASSIPLAYAALLFSVGKKIKDENVTRPAVMTNKKEKP